MFNWFKNKKLALSGGQNPVRVEISVKVEHSPIKIIVEHLPLKVETNELQILSNQSRDAKKEDCGGATNFANSNISNFEPEISIPTNLASPEVGFGKKIT